MPMLTIEIDCGNDAFYDGEGGFSPELELSCILIRFTAALTSHTSLYPDSALPLRDSKGHRVGVARMEDSYCRLSSGRAADAGIYPESETALLADLPADDVAE